MTYVDILGFALGQTWVSRRPDAHVLMLDNANAARLWELIIDQIVPYLKNGLAKSMFEIFWPFLSPWTVFSEGLYTESFDLWRLLPH